LSQATLGAKITSAIQMNIEEKTNFILSIPLFEKLTQKEAQAIAVIAREKTFAPKTAFIKQDEKSDVTHLIYKGTVRAYRIADNGEEVNLAILGPGEIVGEMSLLDEKQHSANVESLQETKALMLPKEDFVKILHLHPDITIKLLQTLSERVRLTDEYVEEVVSKELKDRVWKVLNILANCFSNRDIILSQEELAAIVGATRPRVTEVLNDLQNQRKLTLSHRKIHLT